MKCPKCNNELSTGSKFCNQCGYKFKYCHNPECGLSFPQEAIFCSICGCELIGGVKKEVKKERRPMPVQYANSPKIGTYRSPRWAGSDVYIEKTDSFINAIMCFFVFGSVGIVFIVLVEHDKPFGFICLVVSILSLLLLLFRSTKRIKIELFMGEKLIFMRKGILTGIYLTNKRFIYKSGTQKCDCSFASKNTTFTLWTNFWGKAKGIKVKKEYEDTIKIELDKPQKWFDKIKEFQN